MTEPERRGRGRPKSAEGRRAIHSVRVREEIWQEAEAIARERGETLGQLTEAFLRRYIARYRKRPAE